MLKTSVDFKSSFVLGLSGLKLIASLQFIIESRVSVRLSFSLSLSLSLSVIVCVCVCMCVCVSVCVCVEAEYSKTCYGLSKDIRHYCKHCTQFCTP